MIAELYIPTLAAKDPTIGLIVIGVVILIGVIRWVVEKMQAGGAGAKPAGEDQQTRARELMRQMEEYRKREQEAQLAAREAAKERQGRKPEPRRPREPQRHRPQTETIEYAQVVEAPPAMAAMPAMPTMPAMSAMPAMPGPMRSPLASPARPATLLGMPMTRANVARLLILSDVIGTPRALRDESL